MGDGLDPLVGGELVLDLREEGEMALEIRDTERDGMSDAPSPATPIRSRCVPPPRSQWSATVPPSSQSPGRPIPPQAALRT